jgi:hypothetical protein
VHDVTFPARLRRVLLRRFAGDLVSPRRDTETVDRPGRQELQEAVLATHRGFTTVLATITVPALDAPHDRTGARPTFAFEGESMALALLDALQLPAGQRLSTLLEGPARRFAHAAHIGAGRALARLPRSRHRVVLRQLDPMLRWLAYDGLGFHLTHLRRSRRFTPPNGYAGLVACQGRGRAFWFIHGADPVKVSIAVGCAPPVLQPHLWSGVGSAAVLAGGARTAALRRLRIGAGPYARHLAQGAAWAAETSRTAGAVTPHSDTAVRELTGMSTDDAAALSIVSRAGLADDGPARPSFEVWRERVADALAPWGGVTAG